VNAVGISSLMAKAVILPPWLFAILALISSSCRQNRFGEQPSKASPLVSEGMQTSPESTSSQITPEQAEDLPTPRELSPEERERLMKGTEIEVTPLSAPQATPKR
jgi:hypothetical protein